eukprot:5111544-Amphidinium_carterae.1
MLSKDYELPYGFAGFGGGFVWHFGAYGWPLKLVAGHFAHLHSGPLGTRVMPAAPAIAGPYHAASI